MAVSENNKNKRERSGKISTKKGYKSAEVDQKINIDNYGIISFIQSSILAISKPTLNHLMKRKDLVFLRINLFYVIQ